MRRTLIFGLLAALTACPVSQRKNPPEPYAPDASVPVHDDAAAPITCRDDPSLCAGDEVCSAADTCEKDGTCETSARCGSDHRCVVAAGKGSGACQPIPASCAGCAAHEHCAAAGLCVPAWSEDGRLDPRCTSDAHCGAGGRCTAGVCARCSGDSSCERNLACTDGRCVQRAMCTTNQDCFEGNTCSSGACKMAGCLTGVPDAKSDEPEPLEARYLTGLTLCEDDVDAYSFVLAEGQGARLVVRNSTVAPMTPMTIAASIKSRDGAAPAILGELAQPGVTVFELPTANIERGYLLTLSSEDVAGHYMIGFEVIDHHCAGDRFDLYGDTSKLTAPMVDPNASYEGRLCPGDVDYARVQMNTGDSLAVASTVEGAPPLHRLQIESSTVSQVIAEGVQTSSTSSAAMARYDGPAPTEWVVALEAHAAPTAGYRYRLAVDRTLGALFRACLAPPMTGSLHTAALAAAIDLGAPSCTPFAIGTAADEVVEIPIPALTQVMRARASPAAGANQRVALMLTSTCTELSAPVGCDASVNLGESAAVEYVPATTLAHSVFVMLSADSSTATVDLSVDFDASADESCVGATPLPPVLGAAGLTMSIDTRGAVSSLRNVSACGGAAPDRFVSYTLPARERLALRLTGASSSVLSAAPSCDFATRCSGRAIGSPAHPAELVLGPHDVPLDYTVAIGGVGRGDVANYTLEAFGNPACTSHLECDPSHRCIDYACVLNTMPPPNDRCNGTAIPLAGGSGLVEGDTSLAANTFDPVCSRAANDSGFDVVYSVFVPAGFTTLTAEITEATFDAVLEIRSACAAGADPSPLACNDDQVGAPHLWPLASAPIGTPGSTFYVIVDGYSPDAYGTFTLRIQAM